MDKISNNNKKLGGRATGYPSIDKPWMKYYKNQLLDYNFPKKSIYQYLVDSVNNNLDAIAMTYFGRKITYAEMIRNIDALASNLRKLGVKKDERVLMLMPNIPETAYFLYACAKIGAVSDFIDPRPDSIDISVSARKVLSIIEEEKINHIVSLDICYLAMLKPIEDELKEKGFSRLIIVSASDSMNKDAKKGFIKEKLSIGGYKFLRQSLSVNDKQHEKVNAALSSSKLEIIKYKNLEYSDCSREKEESVDSSSLAVIVHTSGTTSARPKPIPLSHDNMNAYVYQTRVANMPMNDFDKTLHMLPYFAAYGIVDVAHAGFCHLNNMIQIPEFAPSQMGRFIKLYRPQTVIGAPSWFVSLLEDKSLKKADLSCLSMITYGGDSLEKADEEKINEFLHEHGCKAVMTKGHGMSETCGCASYAIGEYNKMGSIGIPMPYTTYALVNPDTEELLSFEEGRDYIEGELIISSPVVTSGVLDGKVIVPKCEYEGEEYIFTRDIAQMDRNGVMTFCSRSDRSFTRFDGYKIKPHEIENLIKEKSKVKYCVISPYEDKKYGGIMPFATIVLDEIELIDNESKVKFVKELVDEVFTKNEDASSRQMPTRYQFVENMPLTSNGKVDFKSIRENGLDGTEIKVDIIETNLSVEDIRVFV